MRVGLAILASLGRLAAAAQSFVRSKSGSTAIEYTVIAGLLCTAILASLATIAGPLGRLFFEGGPLG